MPGTVQANLVTAGCYPFDKVWVITHNLAYREDRASSSPFVEVIK